MDDLVEFLRAQNRAVFGTEQPTPQEFGRWFDQRYGLWLPPNALRALRCGI